jgi:FixJ family two-component response regulator
MRSRAVEPRERVSLIEGYTVDYASLRPQLKPLGVDVHLHADAASFFADPDSRLAGCLLADAGSAGAGGAELLRQLARRHWRVPVLLCVAHAELRTAVDAMHRGAFYVLQMPAQHEELAALVARALDRSRPDRALLRRIERLSPRDRELLALLASGITQREIARRLGVTAHTVGNRRDLLAAALQVRSSLDLLRTFFEVQARWPDLLIVPEPLRVAARTSVQAHPEWEKVPLLEEPLEWDAEAAAPLRIDVGARSRHRRDSE